IGRNKEEVFKTLVTRGQSKDIYVFVLPVAKELDLKKAAKVVKEKKIELIAVNEINQVTGYIRGGCSPIGMKKIYQTLIDESGKNLSSFIISGGKICLQLELCPDDLASVIPVRFANIILEEA
ncbi:MAG: Cys-tRNA(Pro) deacylase, partial [Turicibacter sp.]|nr:Cys-tRNA(Pro) deacylase [Turicibacter sp.]